MPKVADTFVVSADPDLVDMVKGIIGGNRDHCQEEVEVILSSIHDDMPENVDERRRVHHEYLRRSLRDHFGGRGYKTEWAEGVGEVKEKGGMVGGAEDGTREGGR